MWHFLLRTVFTALTSLALIECFMLRLIGHAMMMKAEKLKSGCEEHQTVVDGAEGQRSPHVSVKKAAGSSKLDFFYLLMIHIEADKLQSHTQLNTL